MDSDTDNSIIVEKNNPTIDFKWVKKAINALLKHEAAQPKKVNNDLLLADQPVTIWLIITTFKFSDKPKLKPVSIPLKHPLYGSSTEICLITKDPQKTYKEWVKTHEVKLVQKVIGVSKLNKKYMPYEAKRNLCDSYDLFLADERVLPLLPKKLGKYFFEKKKQPVPVNISKETIFKKEILKACHCTYMHYSSGVCLSIKIGTTGMTSDQLLENLEMVIPVVIDKIPRKWKNIQSLYIKTPESTSLPIYNRLPDLPIEITKDMKKETPKNYGDGIESEIKISDLDSGESDSGEGDSGGSEGEDEGDNESEDEMDEDEDEVNEKGNDNMMEDDDDDDNTDEDEEEDKTDEEKPVKKRKISKETRSVIVVSKSNKNSQVKNFSANKKEEKKAPNIKDKEDVNKKESIVKVKVTKKSNMKKAGKKANGAIKANVTAEPKKANVKGKEARIMAEAKKNNSKNEESNSNQADSNRNKQKKSSNIIMTADFTTNTKNMKKGDKKDLLDEEISSFIAEQKKKNDGSEKSRI